MPYKNKEDSRAAWKRWYHRNRKKHNEYRRIQKQAIRAHPVRQPCSIAECDVLGERHHPDYSKPKDIIWLCKYHHEKEHHKQVCVICRGKHLAKGYCNKHYKQMQREKLKKKNAKVGSRQIRKFTFKNA